VKFTEIRKHMEREIEQLQQMVQNEKQKTEDFKKQFQQVTIIETNIKNCECKEEANMTELKAEMNRQDERTSLQQIEVEDKITEISDNSLAILKLTRMMEEAAVEHTKERERLQNEIKQLNDQKLLKTNLNESNSPGKTSLVEARVELSHLRTSLNNAQLELEVVTEAHNKDRQRAEACLSEERERHENEIKRLILLYENKLREADSLLCHKTKQYDVERNRLQTAALALTNQADSLTARLIEENNVKVRAVGAVKDCRMEDMMRDKEMTLLVLSRLQSFVNDLLAAHQVQSRQYDSSSDGDQSRTTDSDVMGAFEFLGREFSTLLEALQEREQKYQQREHQTKAVKSPHRVSKTHSSTPYRKEDQATYQPNNGINDMSLSMSGSERYRGRDKKYGEAKSVKTVASLNGDGSHRNGTNSASDSMYLGVGARVKARFKEGTKYFPGTVVRERLDGSYDIEYDDGTREMSVAGALVCPLYKPSHSSPAVNSHNILQQDTHRLGVGSIVQTVRKYGSGFITGTIVRERLNGTCDIEYDNGDSELCVQRNRLQSIGEKHDIKQVQQRKEFSDLLTKGSNVEVRHTEGVYFPGTVMTVRDNGTYDILYIDGSREQGVHHDLIRMLSRSPPSRPSRSAGHSRSQAFMEHRNWRIDNGDRPNTGQQLRL